MRAPERLLVISPHFDDGVLACGQWLASRPGALVVTVFAGVPDTLDGVTDWDRACGFDSSRRAMQARRAEDDAALACLHARGLRLPFCDAQYNVPSPVSTIAVALAGVLSAEQPATVAFPLGLFHGDHVLVREATLRAAQRAAGDIEFVAYEDALYRRLPGSISEALSTLREAGVTVGAPVRRHDPATLAVKREAVACYASQLRGLATPGRLGHADALEAEHYWRVDIPRYARAA